MDYSVKVGGCNLNGRNVEIVSVEKCGHKSP